MIIDISDEEDDDEDDDEDEDEETQESLLLHPLNIANHNDNDNDAPPPSTSTVSEPPESPSLPANSGAAEAAASSTDEQTGPPGRPQCEHDKDPPFVTDGRGRVVWSRTARGTQAQAQVERERRRLSPAMKVRGQTSETGVSATDGRGRVVSTGQEAPEVAGDTDGD
jgi:hypothetical protein